MNSKQALFTGVFAGIIVLISSYFIPNKLILNLIVAAFSAFIGGILATKFIK
jgi:hypothetical protein